MVSQLSKVSPIRPNFDYIKNIYEVCLENYLNNHQPSYGTWQNARNAIEQGRKILESDDEVDTYIAFYGAQHYYKLVETFDALDMSRFGDQELEIFSYGCGTATDICSLISYCRSKETNLPFKKVTLIEPSNIALARGVQYINQALSTEEINKINKITIKQVNKTISDLEVNDIDSNTETSKLHIFSNVLDIQAIQLENLALLIQQTQKGDNYFTCINPKNQESQSRIDDFYEKMSKLFQLSDISINNTTITQKKNLGYETK